MSTLLSRACVRPGGTPIAIAIALGLGAAGTACPRACARESIAAVVVGPAVPGAASAPAPAATLVVAHCLDDGSPGSLRQAVAAARNGDVVDLSTLTCATITLVDTSLVATASNLTVRGSNAHPLTIVGPAADRVIRHTGSGVLTIDQLTITHGNFDPDSNALGGCIYSHGGLALVDSVVASCSVGHAGAGSGGAAFANDELTATRTRVEDSYSGSRGGGLFSQFGGVHLVDSTVSGNAATVGGGIYTFGGDIVLEGSTLAGNTASAHGGGAFSYFSDIRIHDSTVSGNVAGTGGGGIAAWHGLEVRNSTITANSAASGGGVLLDTAVVASFVSSIVAGNSATQTTRHDIDDSDTGLPLSGNHDFIGTSSAPVPSGTLTGDPGLGPLADNGGPTRTHALLAGSLAIDGGSNPDALAFDQRGTGFPRTLGAATDIGAYESGGLPPSEIIFADGFDGP